MSGLATPLEQRRYSFFYYCSATLACAFQTREKLNSVVQCFSLSSLSLSPHTHPIPSFALTLRDHKDHFTTSLARDHYPLQVRSTSSPPLLPSLLSTLPHITVLHSDDMATQSNYSTASPTATPSFGNLSDPPTTLKLLVIGKLPTAIHSVGVEGTDRIVRCDRGV